MALLVRAGTPLGELTEHGHLALLQAVAALSPGVIIALGDALTGGATAPSATDLTRWRARKSGGFRYQRT